jgi:hypothetical protein
MVEIVQLFDSFQDDSKVALFLIHRLRDDSPSRKMRSLGKTQCFKGNRICWSYWPGCANITYNGLRLV